MEDKNGIPNKKKRKGKILKYTLLVLLVLVLGVGGFAAYEYNRVQPQNHFKTVPNVTENKPVTTSGVFNVLLLGSDARPGDKLSHTDSMVILHVNLNKHEYHMISIPRDTRVYLDGYGYTKITSAQYITQANKGTQAGIEEAIHQVKSLTGLDINYYVETSYWGFQDMVNAIGGITMNVPFDVTLTHPWFKEDLNMVIKQGTHTFDGKMAAEITHERYSVPGTDYGRQRLQAEALIGIIKAVEDPANITKLPDLVKTLPQYVIATNLTTEDMLSFGLAAKGFERNQLQYYQVPGTSKSLYDDVLKNNNSQIVLNKEKMQEVVDAHFKN